MAKKSIGDLHAKVTADAVQFVEEFNRADNHARRKAASIKKTLGDQFGAELGKASKKFTAGLLGGGAAASVIGELRDVAANIESMPAIPQATIESIRLMNYEFAQSRKQVGQAAAQLVSWFSQFGQSIGYFAGAVTYGSKSATAAFDEMQQEANEFARLGFNKEMADLVTEFEKLAEITRRPLFKEAINEKELEREAEVLERFAASGDLVLDTFSNARLQNLQKQLGLQGGASQADRDAAALEAAKKRIEVQRQLSQLSVDYTEILKQNVRANEQFRISQLSTGDAVKALKDQQASLNRQLQIANRKESATEKQKEINRITKEFNDIGIQIQQITSRVKTVSQEMRDVFVQGIQDMDDVLAAMITGGGNKFKEFLKSLADDIVKMFVRLALINPILNSLFGSSSGWQALPSLFGGFGGGKDLGGGVEAGRFYRVNERDQEFFKPNQGGTIIPVGIARGMAEKQNRAATVINADLRGASVEAVNRLWQFVREMDATLNVRSVAAVGEAMERGQLRMA